MKLVFAFYDKDVKRFGDPRLSELTEENLIDQLSLAILKGFDDSKAIEYQYQVMYIIGNYDNASGVFEACAPRAIIDFDQLLLQRAKIKASRVKLNEEVNPGTEKVEVSKDVSC